MSRDRRIEFAKWLLEAGAGASARNVLGNLRGAEANRIRIASQSARLRAGVYCLVTLPGSVGAVLPLRPSPGHPRSKDPAFRDACVTAFELARTILEERSLPMLRFELEEELEVFGPSIGLPAALAFLAFYAPSRMPERAVLATGALSLSMDGRDGRVGDVGHLEAKQAVAREERADPEPLLLLSSRDVATFEEARKRVFGEPPIRLDVTQSPLDVIIYRARTFASAWESIALLESVDRAALRPADRARVMFDLGTFHRNVGHNRRAWALHEEARGLLATERHVIGEEASERYELECWATELDQYRLDEATSALRERLGRPFLKLRNELRCRGMLAQALAMRGEFAQAVSVREENLKLHDRSDALGKIRPMTLCLLALDAGLGKDEERFDRYVVALAESTKPGDENQWRYNAAAIVRGLVSLGRHELAVRFCNDEAPVFDCRSPQTLVLAANGTSTTITAPEITAMRALVRALRRLNRPNEAIRVGQKSRAAAGDPPELFGWMSALLTIEVAQAHHDAEKYEESESLLRTARSQLVRTHQEATAFHKSLLGSATEAEGELDRVWY